MKHLFEQFLKFAAVGITAFFIDIGLLIFLTEVNGFDYLVSATISFTVSTIFNYVFSMRYVYVHKDNLTLQREMRIFFALSVVALLLNNALMFASVEILRADYRISKIFVTFLVSIYNFFSRKKFLDAS
ncbi:MAG: GtrA family protein [Eggerthellaceae bacterium]|nr:GtrA family protein [Eggerthellaceae bacterium]